ncbi:frataxin, mitochondrial [Gastrolobium bilobum]|uniref:frataxin, mitochondrial n=1 Tax=Gastrolobium bilobum TaxID=150636 RepID=UPI002AB16F59|nr:frataxin, mitochondrial [Gastrolobium bilobum]
MASKLLLRRRLLQLSKPSLLSSSSSSSSSIHGARFLSVKASEIVGLFKENAHLPPLSTSSRSFCSRSSNLLDESQAPTTIDYRSLLQEDEFHRLADSTIHSLQEKLEDYGDSVEIDGFDIDYANDVLTVKLGDLGTYVLNKQTPNRQLWLSSPVSGPSRFDWDQDTKTWIYRRNKTKLYKILEVELEQLCDQPIVLS